MVSVGDQGTADWANDRPGAATGTFSVTPVANTPTSTAITFPTGMFTSAPVVVATIVSSANVTMQVQVSSVTATGCLIWIIAPNTTGRSINWVAVGN